LLHEAHDGGNNVWVNGQPHNLEFLESFPVVQDTCGGHRLTSLLAIAISLAVFGHLPKIFLLSLSEPL
jgi:hypothetical protein